MYVQAEKGWNGLRERYVCGDLKEVTVLCRTARVRDLDGRKTVPGSSVVYTRDYDTEALLPKIEISGVEYSRNMETVFGGSDGIRTMTFPNMVRAIRQGSFYEVKSLRAVVLNEGLEVLGTEEYDLDDEINYGVFEDSGLNRVQLPSTLKRIEYCAFFDCKNLKNIRLPENLEYIGRGCFARSVLESVQFPSALKTIDGSAFYECKNLKTVQFREGLERINRSAFD